MLGLVCVRRGAVLGVLVGDRWIYGGKKGGRKEKRRERKEEKKEGKRV